MARGVCSWCVLCRNSQKNREGREARFRHSALVDSDDPRVPPSPSCLVRKNVLQKNVFRCKMRLRSVYDCRLHFTPWNLLLHALSRVLGMDTLRGITYLGFWSALVSFSVAGAIHENSHRDMASRIGVSDATFQFMHVLVHGLPIVALYSPITVRGTGLVTAALHVIWGILVSGKRLNLDRIYVRIEDWTLLWCISVFTPNLVEFLLHHQ